MHKGTAVIYVDGLGREHEALVTAINGLHPSNVSMVYVDPKAEERDNLVRVYDVAHKDDETKQDVREVRANGPNAPSPTVIDGNAGLPHYDVHCWKEYDEEHKPLPEDHPAFDHPFGVPEKDQAGNRIPVVRTEYERQIEQHRAESGYVPPAPSTDPPPVTAPSEPQGLGDVEQMAANHRGHLDALIADRLATEKRADASLPQADGDDGQPSGADLDAIAEEQAAKEATTPKKNNVRQIKGK